MTTSFRNIKMVDFKPEYLIPIKGYYLIRAIDVETSAIHYYVIYCYIVMDKKTERFKSQIDKEQIKKDFVLQISEQPLK